LNRYIGQPGVAGLVLQFKKYVKSKARRISSEMAHHRSAIVFGRKYFAKEEKTPLRTRDFNYNMRRKPLQDGVKT